MDLNSLDHEALLRHWKGLRHHAGRPFIVDGIIDPKRWASARPRVMFLLKEAYTDEREGFDLRQLIRDEWRGWRYNMWKVTAEWAYLLQGWASGQIPTFSEDNNALNEALLSSAVVNVKKSGGNSQSDFAEIDDFARRDADLLRRQVELIDPDVVLCGYTWHAARVLWPDATPVAGPHDTADRLYHHGRRLIIDFWHPSIQTSHDLHYYALAGILKVPGIPIP